MESIKIDFDKGYTIDEILQELHRLYPFSQVGFVEANPPQVSYFFVDDKKIII